MEVRFQLQVAVTLALVAGCAGCGGVAEPSAQTPPREPASAGAELGHRANLPLVAFLGDSLTAGHGLARDQAYPELVRIALARRGTDFRVINSGVSGDTSAGGLARLDWILGQEPDVVVVALGANDGLRGLSLVDMEGNLRAIVARARAAGARLLLAGMRMPPNYGPEYVEGFRAVFPRVAEELDVPFVPFLLEGVAAAPELNQADGIHPTASGQARLAENVAPLLEELLGEVAGQ